MTTLTTAQLQSIKADILASSDLNVFPDNGDGEFEIARLYNLPAVPAFSVWRTDASVSDIYDGIDFSKFTPTDSPEITGIYTARALAIQIKQMNLQNMLQGRDRINMAKVTIRSSLRDAVIQIPSGTAGVFVSAAGASGVNVLSAGPRNATRIEKLLATASLGSDTTGTVTARVMGFEGSISPQDIHNAKVS